MAAAASTAVGSTVVGSTAAGSTAVGMLAAGDTTGEAGRTSSSAAGSTAGPSTEATATVRRSTGAATLIRRATIRIRTRIVRHRHHRVTAITAIGRADDRSSARGRGDEPGEALLRSGPLLTFHARDLLAVAADDRGRQANDVQGLRQGIIPPVVVRDPVKRDRDRGAPDFFEDAHQPRNGLLAVRAPAPEENEQLRGLLRAAKLLEGGRIRRVSRRATAVLGQRLDQLVELPIAEHRRALLQRHREPVPVEDQVRAVR